MGGAALPSDKNFAISTNFGNYDGQSALAVSAQARLNDYAVLNGGIGAGLSDGGTGTRLGLTLAW